MGNSTRDIKVIHGSAPADLADTCDARVAPPLEGNAFDFNALKGAKFLVVCTSSQMGYPPDTIW